VSQRSLLASALLALITLSSSIIGCGDDSRPSTGTDGGNGLPDGTTADDGGGDDAALTSTMRPSKRSDVGGLSDPATGLMAVFGGDDGPIVSQFPMPAFLADTWVFEPGFGWSAVESTPAPFARGRHAVALDSTNGRMLMFGGRWRREGGSGNYTLYNDLWAFDFATKTWSELHPGTGLAPRPRFTAGLAHNASSGNIFVMGGGLNENALAADPATDLWAFDGSTWTEIPTTGSPPSMRLWMAYAYDTSRNRIVAFGGQRGDFVSASLRDLYALDLSTGAWSQLDAGFSSGPEGRFSATMTYDATRDRYLLFGGHGDPGVVNDLWAYDPNGGGWAVLSRGDTWGSPGLGCLGNEREIPKTYVNQELSSPERRSGAVFTAVGDTVWLFGGESDCSDHLDDTWSFDLVSNTWRQWLEARSGESCDRRGDDCTCLCL